MSILFNVIRIGVKVFFCFNNYNVCFHFSWNQYNQYQIWHFCVPAVAFEAICWLDWYWCNIYVAFTNKIICIISYWLNRRYILRSFGIIYVWVNTNFFCYWVSDWEASDDGTLRPLIFVDLRDIMPASVYILIVCVCTGTPIGNLIALLSMEQKNILLDRKSTLIWLGEVTFMCLGTGVKC